MAMRINVTTTPTSTPSTGVICTRTAREDAENFKDVKFVVFSGELKRRTLRGEIGNKFISALNRDFFRYHRIFEDIWHALMSKVDKKKLF